MKTQKWSRRDVLKTPAGLAAGTMFAEPVRAARSVAVQRDAGTDRGRAQGRQDLLLLGTGTRNVAERLAKVFEAKYPGIAVRVERSGAERIYQRIAQEQDSGINAVDVANSTDPAHYLDWKSKDWLGGLIFPTMSPSTFSGPTSSIRTDFTRPHVPGWRSLATTPAW